MPGLERQWASSQFSPWRYICGGEYTYKLWDIDKWTDISTSRVWSFWCLMSGSRGHWVSLTVKSFRLSERLHSTSDAGSSFPLTVFTHREGHKVERTQSPVASPGYWRYFRRTTCCWSLSSWYFDILGSIPSGASAMVYYGSRYFAVPVNSSSIT